MNIDIIKKVIDNRFLSFDQTSLIEDRSMDSKKSFVAKCKIKESKDFKTELYKFDTEDVFPFFSNRKGYKRMSDYLLFAEKNDIVYVISIELKKTTRSGSPKQQLVLTENFAKFLLERIKIIDKEPVDNVKYIRVAIKSGSKLTTKGYAEKLNGYGYLPLYGYEEFRIESIIKLYSMFVDV